MYSSSLGRFLQRDPDPIEPSVNPYRYCRNAPTHRTDPSGTVDWGSLSLSNQGGTSGAPDRAGRARPIAPAQVNQRRPRPKESAATPYGC